MRHLDTLKNEAVKRSRLVFLKHTGLLKYMTNKMHNDIYEYIYFIQRNGFVYLSQLMIQDGTIRVKTNEIHFTSP